MQKNVHQNLSKTKFFVDFFLSKNLPQKLKIKILLNEIIEKVGKLFLLSQQQDTLFYPLWVGGRIRPPYP